ncbi:hypothetical protein [Tropicimonas sp. IMCC34011]|uniref:hypothetical protein n=1 Tax=Tropicimonas sp. IMCC34011 TaxID=2248759 RepID=UPI000E241416|nr:hypothetical protein [Tropicimonas sp. IMCC34011]
MSLTHEERTAIAAYPEDAVQRIPRGQSGLPFDLGHWKDRAVGVRHGVIAGRQAKFKAAARKRARRQEGRG